jgi:hypothetical protein
MNSVENTRMSGISMEELISIGEYFSGNIPSNEEQFETGVEKFLENPYFEREKPEEEPIVIRPRPRRIPKNYTGKRGTTPQWKYSKRQQEKAALIEEAFERLKGTPGLPETTGGLWYTDNDLIKAEVEKIKAERNPKIPKKRGRPPKVKTDEEVKVTKKRGRPPKVKADEEMKVPKKRGRPPKVKTDEEVKVTKKRGRPPKVKTDEEVKVTNKRGRPPKVKADEEVKVPKKRGRPPKVKTEVPPKKRQTVADCNTGRQTCNTGRQCCNKGETW